MKRQSVLSILLISSIAVAKGCSCGSKARPETAATETSASTSSGASNLTSSMTVKPASVSYIGLSSSFPLTAYEKDITNVSILYVRDMNPDNPAEDTWTHFALTPSEYVSINFLDPANSPIFSRVIDPGRIAAAVVTVSAETRFTRQGDGCTPQTAQQEATSFLMLSTDVAENMPASAANRYALGTTEASPFWQMKPNMTLAISNAVRLTSIVTAPLPIVTVDANNSFEITLGMSQFGSDTGESCSSQPPGIRYAVTPLGRQRNGNNLGDGANGGDGGDDFGPAISRNNDDFNSQIETTDVGVNFADVYQSFCINYYKFTLRMNSATKELIWTMSKYTTVDCADNSDVWTATVDASYEINTDDLFINQFASFLTTITNISMLPRTPAGAAELNGVAACGRTNWSSGVAQDVSDCSVYGPRNSDPISFIVTNYLRVVKGIYIFMDSSAIILFDEDANVKNQVGLVIYYRDPLLVDPPICGQNLGLALTASLVCSPPPSGFTGSLLLNDYMNSLPD